MCTPGVPRDSRRVGELTESEILGIVFAALEGSSRAIVGPGDDAAVLDVPSGRAVVTTDTLVHGPDFRLAWSRGYDLGYKSAAVNLSDVAAMGATPTALFIALVLPRDLPASLVSEFARGARACCDDLAPGCAVEGGDLTTGETFTIAVTAVGVMDEGIDPVRRSGARAGDVVAVAGALGHAARGLRVLFERFHGPDGPLPVDDSILTASERDDVAVQLRPQPPIERGRVAARAGATAMMDVSDGLLMDATRMARASSVTIDLFAGLDDDALRGGEDHALLATFPSSDTPEGFAVIGHVIERGTAPVTINGAPASGRGGWDPYVDWDSARG